MPVICLVTEKKIPIFFDLEILNTSIENQSFEPVTQMDTYEALQRFSFHVLVIHNTTDRHETVLANLKKPGY